LFFQQTAKLHKYCISAVTGFVRSIALSEGNSLQDTLRLLTLWFDYGQVQDVYDALVEGIKTIHIDNWLQVCILYVYDNQLSEKENFMNVPNPIYLMETVIYL
jgi:phosphatidylinositol kinase/protein kinase (PI-3  family)